MTVTKEKAETRISAPQQRNNDTDGELPARRRQGKYSNWLSDSRQYRRAAINRQSWIGSEGLE